LPSDELFTPGKGPQIQWEGLEKRVNTLLEGIVQLRNANGQLMKENVHLKNQLKDAGETSTSDEELIKLHKQYDEALQDLKRVKDNLGRIESLAKELKLEN